MNKLAAIIARLRGRSDRRNIEAIVAHYGLPYERAAQVYHRAHEIGFAAAYLEVVLGIRRDG